MHLELNFDYYHNKLEGEEEEMTKSNIIFVSNLTTYKALNIGT